METEIIKRNRKSNILDMAESKLSQISRKSGQKISFCKCTTCKAQCYKAPCMGTPEDIEKIIDAGHGKKIMATVWAVGTLRDGREVVEMYQAIHDPVTTHCVFFKDGLCTLHDLGLKPTEGKLSNHTVHKAAKIGKTLAFLVANEWTDKKNRETIERIEEKLQHSKNQ